MGVRSLLTGVVIFSGSLYLLAVTGIRELGEPGPVRNVPISDPMRELPNRRARDCGEQNGSFPLLAGSSHVAIQ